MKKINKRACRAYADPHLKMRANNGLLISDKYAYIVRTAVKIIAGQKLLLIYIYSREQAALGQFVPLWTIFQSKTEHFTLARKADDSTVWHTGKFEYMASDYYFVGKCTFYTLKDKERMDSYCSGSPSDGFHSLTRLQEKIGERRRNEKQKKIDRKTIQRMAVLPALPRGLNNWIHRNIMPAILFYDYQKKKGSQKAYCTSCQKEVEITGAKYKAEGICPNCKRTAVFKSRGKRGYTEDRATCQIMQKVGPEELIVRIIKVIYCFSDKDEPKKIIYENARFFIRTGEKTEYRIDPYYYSYTKGILTRWQYGTRPSFMNSYHYNFEPDISGYLYLKNLDDALHGTRWQYCQLKTFYAKEPQLFTVLDYLAIYMKYPLLEYLVKLRLHRLASNLVFYHNSYDTAFNLEGKNIREVLGIDMKYFPYIQSLDPDNTQLKFIKAMIESIGYLDKELIEWCFSHKIHDTHIMQYLLNHISAQKLTRYADHQVIAYSAAKGSHRDMRNLLVLYRDYIRMCYQMNYDMTNDFVVFPRHLEESHNLLSDRISKNKGPIFDRRIKAQFPILREQYQFMHKGFMIIPPQSALEITQEGHKLRHCVGSYLDSVAASECTILFVRDVKKPRKPLCTVEIRDKQIKQARCYRNQDPPAEIKEFLSLWEKKVLQIPERKPLAA